MLCVWGGGAENLGIIFRGVGFGVPGAVSSCHQVSMVLVAENGFECQDFAARMGFFKSSLALGWEIPASQQILEWQLTATVEGGGRAGMA